MTIRIRHERVGDIQPISALTAAAFLEAPHTDHTEQYVVAALRQAGALTLSLVAEHQNHVVGHVAASPVTLSDGTENWYGLGPLSVAPVLQRQGIGSALMRGVLAELKDIGAHGCVLLGDPNYYRRFGFKTVEGLTLPGMPPEYFQAILFEGRYPGGSVTYHAAFSATY